MTIHQTETIKATPTLDKAYYIRLCNMLLLPFNRQDAYRMGIIDSNGNELKQPENDLEKNAYTPLHQLAFGLKKFILKQPGGYKLLQLSAHALNTLHTKKNSKLEPKDVQTLTENFGKIHQFIVENALSFPFEEILIEEFLEEDDGGAAVASGTEPAAEPTNKTENVDGVTLPIGQTIKRKTKNVVDGVDV